MREWLLLTQSGQFRLVAAKPRSEQALTARAFTDCQTSIRSMSLLASHSLWFMARDRPFTRFNG